MNEYNCVYIVYIETRLFGLDKHIVAICLTEHLAIEYQEHYQREGEKSWYIKRGIQKEKPNAAT